jgi:hypothetical protein
MLNRVLDLDRGKQRQMVEGPLRIAPEDISQYKYPASQDEAERLYCVPMMDTTRWNPLVRRNPVDGESVSVG